MFFSVPKNSPRLAAIQLEVAEDVVVELFCVGIFPAGEVVDKYIFLFHIRMNRAMRLRKQPDTSESSIAKGVL